MSGTNRERMAAAIVQASRPVPRANKPATITMSTAIRLLQWLLVITSAGCWLGAWLAILSGVLLGTAETILGFALVAWCAWLAGLGGFAAAGLLRLAVGIASDVRTLAERQSQSDSPPARSDQYDARMLRILAEQQSRSNSPPVAPPARSDE